MSGDEILQVTEVSKSFGGVQALLKVSFNVDRGEVFGIIGPNGSGKTTTFKLLLGLVRPTAGAVQWNGGRPGRAETRETVGFAPAV